MGRLAVEPLLAALEERAHTTPGYAWECALAHAGLMHRDESLMWLERAADERSPLLVSTGAAPLLDVVREERRFRALERRLGLADA